MVHSAVVWPGAEPQAITILSNSYMSIFFSTCTVLVCMDYVSAIRNKQDVRELLLGTKSGDELVTARGSSKVLHQSSKTHTTRDTEDSQKAYILVLDWLSLAKLYNLEEQDEEGLTLRDPTNISKGKGSYKSIADPHRWTHGLDVNIIYSGLPVMGIYV
ncbi:unnamed protein product [Timema podura]|uniref:Uncharacterized protein n=1 Tax=Timema podura TaxID=61482 RepID=A0ABN7NU95_TIMPD|nr:unnamed protein product [Timema podura]